MSTESALIEALSNLVITPDPEIQYRLHYNEAGDIIMCSMQSHPESAHYLVVTKEQYESYFRYRVVKERLELIIHNSGVRVPLIKSTRGFRTIKNHAALLLEIDEQYADTEYYDTRNN